MKTVHLTGLLSILCIFCLSLTSCEDAPDITQNPDLAGFEEIQLSGDLVVHISKGDFDVTVDGAITDVSDYQFSVSNGRLIGKYRHSNRVHDQINLEITLPEISYIKLSGKTQTHITGFRDNSIRDLKVQVEGDSFFDAEVDCRDFELKTSGKSAVYLLGHSDTAEVKISGDSNVEAFDFPIQDCEVNLSGKNEVRLYVTSKLSGQLSGKSKLIYDGNPVILDVDADGDSAIIKK